MTRTRIFDYQADDSTLLLNTRLRGILRAGVYHGFNAVPGTSGGLNIDLDMDADPDNTGAKLGVILTPDGVTVQEDADLADVVTVGAADPTNDRIDYVVATYTYNASLPNNDVTYEVLQGTAGAPPTPPTLTDDQVLIAEVRIPPLTVTLTADMIVDVNRLTLYDKTNPPTVDLGGVLRYGVYTGYELYSGSAANQVSVGSGLLFTPEAVKLSEASAQVDLFTLTNTSSVNHYRYDWVVCLHEYEDLEVNEPDYIVVEGTEADESAGAIADLPSDGDILAAATAFDPKYTSQDNITKLGYVRVQGSGGSMVTEFSHTPRLLRETAWYVSAGKLDSNSLGVSPYVQHFPYTGHEGLIAALDLLRSLVSDFYVGADGLDLQQQSVNSFDSAILAYAQPIPLYIDGDFHIPPSKCLGIPSYVSVEGVSAASIRLPAAATPAIAVGGLAVTSASGGNIVIQKATDQSGGLPANHERWEVSCTDAAARASFDGLDAGFEDIRLSGAALAGDPVILHDTYYGWFEKYGTVDIADGPYTFTVIIDVSPGAPPSPIDSAYVKKQFNELSNVQVIQTGTPSASDKGALSVTHAYGSKIRNVRVPSVEVSISNTFVLMENVGVHTHGWDNVQGVDTAARTTGGSNTYNGIDIQPVTAQGIEFGYDGSNLEQGARVGRFSVADADSVVTGVTIGHQFAAISQLLLSSITPSKTLTFRTKDSHVDHVALRAGAFDAVSFYGTNNTIAKLHADAAVTLTWEPVAEGNVVSSIGGSATVTVSDTSTLRNNYILSNNVGAYKGTVYQADEDRCLALQSDGSLTWDATSGELSFTDDLIVDLPFIPGRMIVQQADSPVTLADGDRFWIALDRDATGDTNYSPVVTSKANAVLLRNSEAFIVARRLGDEIYLADGTRLEDGSTSRLGESLPPDGSVTYDKLAPSAKEFTNESLRHWFSRTPYADDNQHLVTVSAQPGATYSKSTGLLLFDTTVNLSSVQPGDTLIDGSGNRWWILATSANAVNLQRGFQVNATSGHQIVRGNVAMRNTSLSGFTWAQSAIAKGTITWGGSVNLDGVKPGHLFRDAAGNLFPIAAVGASSVDIEHVRTEPVVSGSPSSDLEGSVQTNNNPRNLSFYDMRPTLGYEVVTLSDFAPIDPQGTWERRPDGNRAYTYAPFSPYDERIRVYDSNFDGGRASTPKTNFPVNQDGFVNLQNSRLEVTAWCTGIAFIVNRDHDLPSGDTVDFVVDGREFTAIPGGTRSSSTEQPDNWTRGPYGPWTSAPQYITRLPPGVHTVQLVVPTATVFRLYAIVIMNEPDPLSGEYLELPGRIHADQGVFDVQSLDSLSVPSLNSRGGKLVRYLQTDHATRAWAHTEMPTPVAGAVTGDTNNASVTITDLRIGGSPSTQGLQIGDLIRIVYASDPPEKRVITAINPGVSIDVDSAPSVTEGDATLEYVGATAARFTSSQVSGVDNRYNYEQQVQTIPWWAFSTYLNVNPDDKYNQVSNGVSGPLVSMGGDYHHLFYADGPAADSGGTVQLEGSSPGDEIRFSFVGTGLDLLVAPGGTSELTTIYIDGVDIGEHDLGFYSDLSIYRGSDTTQVPYLARIPLCWDLEYGQHEIAMVRFSTNDVRCWAFTTYEPKDPDFEGYPIFKSCYLGAMPLGGSPQEPDQPVTQVRASPSGMLRLPAESLGGFQGGAASFEINPGVGLSIDTDSIGGRTLKWTNVATGTDSYAFIPFYGSAVSVDIRAGVNQLNITPEFLALDGAGWDSPAVLPEATVTGPSGTQSLPATQRARYTWELDIEAFWVLRLTFRAVGAATDADILGAHVRRTWHIAQRRETLNCASNWQPTPAGRDMRQIRAVDALSSAEGVKQYRMAITAAGGWTQLDGNVAVLVYYSRGEWVSIRAFGYYKDTVGASGFNTQVAITINNYYVIQRRQDVGAGEESEFSVHSNFYLPQGFHLIKCYLAGFANISEVTGVLEAHPCPRGRFKDELQRATLDLIEDNLLLP